MTRPGPSRLVRPAHALRAVESDPRFEREFADHLRRTHDKAELSVLLDRFRGGGSDFDLAMRRILWTALGVTLGDGVNIGRNVGLRDAPTIAIGTGTAIGDGVVLQGRHDGRCVIGARVWIGAQAFVDGRDLEIGDDAGIGPGVRIVGSEHTGLPDDLPVIATDLDSRPIRIGAGADIGSNAVILPGVTIGHGAIVGAGAVVTRAVPPRAVAAGVPARVTRARKDRKR
jgi:acetyltransferase-like isoleucine patch superfamily enzyme